MMSSRTMSGWRFSAISSIPTPLVATCTSMPSAVRFRAISSRRPGSSSTKRHDLWRDTRDPFRARCVRRWRGAALEADCPWRFGFDDLCIGQVARGDTLEQEDERASATRGVLDGEASAQLGRKLAAQVQPDARAALAAGGTLIELDESFERALPVLQRDTGTVVDDSDRDDGV